MRYFSLFVIVLILAGCNTKPQIEPVDLSAVETTIAARLDEFHKVMQDKDLTAYKSFLTEDGLFCGTDPEELWGKESVVALMEKSFADSTIMFKYSVEQRKIRVSSDGNSATTLEQFIVAWISEKMTLRLVSHLVKIENDWKIDFFSWSLVPNNDDMAKLNEALAD